MHLHETLEHLVVSGAIARMSHNKPLQLLKHQLFLARFGPITSQYCNSCGPMRCQYPHLEHESVLLLLPAALLAGGGAGEGAGQALPLVLHPDQVVDHLHTNIFRSH